LISTLFDIVVKLDCNWPRNPQSRIPFVYILKMF